MKHTQSGNVLFYILIAVALLASLSYAVTQSGRGSVSGLATGKAGLYASEIIEYGDILYKSVSQIRLRGHKDTEISFENDIISGYANANCTEDGCKIFHINGGGLTFLRPPEKANDGTNWNFTVNNITDIGTTDLELIVILQNINKNVCEQINKKLHGTMAIPQENDSISLTQFTGAYAGAGISDAGNVINGKSAYCFEGNVLPQSGTYHYYQVLISR